MSPDDQLVQIVDAALAEAARKAGPWLVCRPGCTQCCMGVFAIGAGDVRRLRKGLEDLAATDPSRAARVLTRVRDAATRLAPDYPGDPETGLLYEDEESAQRFDEFANDEPCPVLDPETGLCDLYSARPMTCRIFGPPVRCGENAVAVCELCFEGATAEEVAACEVCLDSEVLQEEESARTIVAFALAREEK